MVDVILLGSGGTRPLPSRGLTSLVIRCGGNMLLFDCGEGTQVNFIRGGVNIFHIDSIFITHLHADHVLGFPGLLATLLNMDRKKPLKVFGPKGSRDVLSALAGASGVGLQGLPFRVDFYEYRQKEEHFEFGKYTVDCFKMKHSVDCFGYSFSEVRPAYFCVDKIRGVVPEECWAAIQEGYSVVCNDRVWNRYTLFGHDRQGIKVTYATDTRPTDLLVEHAMDSTLLVLEGMYVGNTEEDVQNAERTKHMTMCEAVSIANRVYARELWLTHLGPAIPSMRLPPASVKRVFKNVHLGRDGMHKELRHKDVVPVLYKGERHFSNIVAGRVVDVKAECGFINEGEIFYIAEVDNNSRTRVLARAVSVESAGDYAHVRFEVLRE